LKFWPEKIHKVAKPDIQLLSGVLLQWLGTFNIHFDGILSYSLSVNPLRKANSYSCVVGLTYYN